MEQTAFVVSVNMGYGHQRTAFPLRQLGQIINANAYSGIPEGDKNIWETTRKFYEAVSRFSRIPLIGKASFSIYDRFQKILSFYPKRDLSKPNFALRQSYSLLEKGWGKHLTDELKAKNLKLKANLPIVSSFFIPAFMAEFFNYPGKIYCIVCDADISRSWAPLEIGKSKIKYFAPTERVAERLKLYGVREENVFLTGYPLPQELIGSTKMEILKKDLAYRLLNLDPQGRYCQKYKVLIEKKLGKLPKKPDHPLTILFSVGGAGAQKEIGIKILQSLSLHIKESKIKMILSAGTRKIVKEYFEKNIAQLGLQEYHKGSVADDFGVEVIFEENINDYFEKFNSALRKTDILWTKPSELSFYSALGIPVIIAPPIGSQEEFNMRWLLKSGFGMLQENPYYAAEWLFDWHRQGYLAEAAMQGFIEGEKLGTFNIKKIVASK